VRGDCEVPYGEIVAAMDELARNGLTRLARVATARSPASEPPADAAARRADGRAVAKTTRSVESSLRRRVSPGWLGPAAVTLVAGVHLLLLLGLDSPHEPKGAALPPVEVEVVPQGAPAREAAPLHTLLGRLTRRDTCQNIVSGAPA